MSDYVCRVGEFPCKNESPGGDLTCHTFSFKAVRSDKDGEFDAPKYSVSFHVRLEVTKTLMACASWGKTESRDRWLYFFAFVRERLSQRPLPNASEVVTLRLDTYADEGSHENGPTQYALDQIDPEEPFTISAPPIGFQQSSP